MHLYKEDAQSLFILIIIAPGSDLQIFISIRTLWVCGTKCSLPERDPPPPWRSTQWVALPDESRLGEKVHSRKFGSSCCTCLETSKVIIISQLST